MGAVAFLPSQARRFEQALRAEHVTGDENIRIAERAVDVGLSSKMGDSTEVKIFQQLTRQVSIENIGMDKLHAGGVGTVEVGAVAGVGQRIEHDDKVVVGEAQPVVYKMRTQEAGAAGDQQALRRVGLRIRRQRLLSWGVDPLRDAGGAARLGQVQREQF